jgi:superfamily II DNA or RNA helicase
MKQRYYQIECERTIYTRFKDGIKTQLIVAATGVGKRFMACQLATKFKGKILFVAHTEELIEQAFNELDRMFPFECGVIKGQRFDIEKRIIVASIQTLYRRLDKMSPDMFEFIIIDEMHHYCSKTYIQPINHFTPRLLTGWSATPIRLDGLSLSNICEEVVYEYPIEQAIADRFLCNLDGIKIATNTDLSKLHKLGGDFNQKELSYAIDTHERNSLIVNKYKNLAENKQAVAFCIDIKHAENLAEKFRDHGITAIAVHSQMEGDERKKAFQLFKEKKIQILTNVVICTEGWDYADIGAVLLCRPTMSLALFLQMIGRGTRLKSYEFVKNNIHPDKINQFKSYASCVSRDKMTKLKGDTLFFKEQLEEEWNEAEKRLLDFLWPYQECKIIDFVDNTGNHKVMNIWDLDKGKSAKKKIFASASSRSKLLAAEEDRKVRLLKANVEKDQKVILLELPTIRFSNGAWRTEKATEGQIEWLKRGGVWQEGVEYTKLQATEFISNFEATDKQKFVLARYGYDVSQGCTVAQAKKCFDEIERKRALIEENNVNKETSKEPF